MSETNLDFRPWAFLLARTPLFGLFGLFKDKNYAELRRTAPGANIPTIIFYIIPINQEREREREREKYAVQVSRHIFFN